MNCPLILTVSEQRAFRLQMLLEKTVLKVTRATTDRPNKLAPSSYIQGEGWNVTFSEGKKPRVNAGAMDLSHVTELVRATNLACKEFPDPTADFDLGQMPCKCQGHSWLKRLEFNKEELGILEDLGFEIQENKTAKVEEGMQSPQMVCRIYLTKPEMGGYLVRVIRSGKMLASCLMPNLESAAHMAGRARQEATAHPRTPSFEFINSSKWFYQLSSDQRQGATQ